MILYQIQLRSGRTEQYNLKNRTKYDTKHGFDKINNHTNPSTLGPTSSRSKQRRGRSFSKLGLRNGKRKELHSLSSRCGVFARDPVISKK